MAETLLKQWEQAFDTLWIEKDGITPTMRLEQLGDAAAELFEANAAMITFVVGMLQGKDDATVAKLMAKVATIPAHTVHEDGTVTLD